MIKGITKSLLSAALTTAFFKEGVEELTESEKAAICYASGAEVVSYFEEGVHVVRTRNECNIVRIEGKFHVSEFKPYSLRN